jgi:short-subunit dehydrogenase
MKDLQNANAIVTGASRGLGAHIARALASSGVNVAVAARSAQQLEAVRAELVSLGVKAVAIRADATVAAERQELVDRAAAELGPIDILVNSAGTELASCYTDLDPAQIDAMVDLNLTAPLLLIRAVLPGMLDRGKGHIVNLSSGAGKVVEPFDTVYSATKFGLIGATHALRAEYLGSPVGFSVVCPGFVRQDGIYARYEAQGLRVPPRVGTTTPQKVASAVLKAIREDRAEIIVSSQPVRPAAVLQAAAPQVIPQLLKRIGLTSMAARAAEMRRTGAVK